MKNNTAKLFTAPKNLGKESERAAIRAKYYDETYSDLSKEWNDKLISSGLDASIVYDLDNARMASAAYTESGEEQFQLYARWFWVADNSAFEMQRTAVAENKRIWKLFAIHGKTEREIAEALDLPRVTVQNRLRILEERCKLDVRAGKLLSTNDTKSEVADWERLQALKRKHLALVRAPGFGELLVDSVTDSLVPKKLDDDSIDALNRVTVILALALGGNK